MRIVVLIKPVPDPASAGERLGPDGRLDRAAVPAVVNGNDEYVLEAALKLIEAAGEGEVTLLSMAPANAPETLRKALAMGATRGVLVTDPALEGSCAVSTARVLAAALRDLEFDLVLRRRRLLRRRRRASCRRRSPPTSACRTCRTRREIEPDMAAPDGSRPADQPTGYDLLEAPMPVVIGGTQALGEPRYPSLKGIMAARNKEIVTRSLADLGIDPASVGGAVATTRSWTRGSRRPRAATEVVRGTPAEGAARIVDVPRRAEDHLMGGLWVVAEPGPDGGLARISTEVATLARELAAAAGLDVSRDRRRRRSRPRRRGARDVPAGRPGDRGPAAADHAWSAVAAGHIAGLLGADGDPMPSSSGPVRTAATWPGRVSALTGLGRAGQRDGRDLDRRRAGRRDERVRRQAA